MAHFPKLQDRLLMLAETHLANHPAIFNRLRTDVEHGAHHTIMMTEPVRGMEYGYAVSTGLFAKVDARLLIAIDDWANNQPELQSVRQAIPSVTPPSVGAAAATANDPEPGNAPPVDTAVASSNGTRRKDRTTWNDVADSYLTQLFTELQNPTVKVFYRSLEKKAGTDSPFDIGTEQNSGYLFAREPGVRVSEKMIATFVTKLRKKA